MEPQFKTSFIPKQSLERVAEAKAPRTRSHVPTSLASIVTFVILLAAAGAAGGYYLYTQYLSSSITQKTEMLQRAQEAFQPALIRDLARLDQRINSGQELLNSHLAPSYIFRLIEQVTLKTVQFETFSYTDTGGIVTVTMKGRAPSFESVALQSDVIGSNQFIREPVVSGVNTSGTGAVTFNVTATIDPRLISYVAVTTAQATQAAQKQQVQQQQELQQQQLPADAQQPTL